jgi:hypothetical protein
MAPIVTGGYAVAAEDVEAGMFPHRQHLYHLPCDLVFFQEHSKNIVPEESFQLFQLQRRSDAKHPTVAIKTAVGYEDVAVRIESEGIANRLHRDDGAGDGIIFRNRMLEKNLQGFPVAAAEGGKEFSIIQKVATKNLRNTEHEMPVVYLFEDVHADPLPKCHHTFLMAGRTKMPSFTRKCPQVFMPAIFAFHTGKTVLQIAAIQITVDHLFYIRPPETILLVELFIIALHKSFKIILYTMVIIRILQVAGPVNGGWQ